MLLLFDFGKFKLDRSTEVMEICPIFLSSEQIPFSISYSTCLILININIPVFKINTKKKRDQLCPVCKVRFSAKPAPVPFADQ